MPPLTQTNDQWWVNDQVPDNPFAKSEDYEFGLDHPGLCNAAFCPGTVTRRSVRKGMLAFTNHERGQRSIAAGREISGLLWIQARLRLVAPIARSLITFDVINRASERHSFSPAT